MSATVADPHAAPCCTNRQAAAVIDHLGIHEGRLGRNVSPIGIHRSGPWRGRRPRWHPQRSPWSGGGRQRSRERGCLSSPFAPRPVTARYRGAVPPLVRTRCRKSPKPSTRVVLAGARRPAEPASALAASSRDTRGLHARRAPPGRAAPRAGGRRVVVRILELDSTRRLLDSDCRRGRGGGHVPRQTGPAPESGFRATFSPPSPTRAHRSGAGQSLARRRSTESPSASHLPVRSLQFKKFQRGGPGRRSP